MDIQCLDAALHNRPERIAEKLDAALSRCHGSYDLIFIAYADCGTQGGADRVAAKFGAQRLRVPIVTNSSHQVRCFMFLQMQNREPFI